MFKTKLGDQFDDSKAVIRVDADRHADSSLEVGSQHNRSQRRVSINARGTDQKSGGSIWGRGLFFVLTLVILIVIFVFVATKYSIALATASLAGALVILYFFGLILIPGTVTEKGFISVMRAVFFGK